ncbi:protease inhibitor I42 family protein [Clostridium sp. ZBS15]|uniref:protease inhibitor I42 family protein n=1 Tax=Clostridium sp. ZBS15 TaxID=2949969 RepID=UPI002079C42E|nr:protease inhibitor I42 family protein [Clostridium sp. ZBS15]
MKKSKILLTGILGVVLSFSFIPKEANAAWIKDTNGWWYSQLNYVIGWKQINNAWYYFDNNGYMKTGWIYDNGTWYYADLNGAIQSGVIEVNGKTYYLDKSGAMAKGNIVINKRTYTFAMSGESIGDKIPQATKAFLSNGVETEPTKINNVYVASGKVVEINIEGNPTTGYTWNYEFNTDGIIKEEWKDYKQDNVDSEIQGAGGTYTWKFSAVKEGTTKVTFKYYRPWENEILETKTYIFTVDKDLNITVEECNI